MDMDFKGKTAIVTGGTRGIGSAICKKLYEHRCNVIYTGQESYPNTKNDTRLHYLPLNFLDNHSIQGFIKKIEQLESIDILINNAGINAIESIHSITEENWENILQVNLTGPMLLTKAVSKIMKKSQSGRILNISSIWGVISKEKRNAYSASKTGVLGLTRSSALDLAQNNILVNALCPGFTDTELTRTVLSKAEIKKLTDQIPLKRFAHVDEIAEISVFLCSDRNTYITGQVIIADGGFTIK